MTLKEDFNELETRVEETSFAMELLQYSKQQNEHLEKNYRRLFIVLIIVIMLWFLSMIGGYYYMTHFVVQTDIQTADATDGGNACIGNDCYNGDIQYGKN